MATKKSGTPSRPPCQPIKAWSFSTYADYKLCPSKVYYKKVLKLKEPPNAAMERGDQIHKLAERYIKGDIPVKIPPELALFEKEFKELRAKFRKISQSMVIEDSWAMTKAWEETAWNDWAGCWLRLKLDCAFHVDDTTLRINDWKTGKFREDKNEDYQEQLELYALVALILHDHIQTVTPFLVYLDQGVVYPSKPEDAERMTYTRDMIPALKKTWEKRTRALLSDTVFAPRPNNLCGWCFFRKDNNGPCSF